MVVGIETGVHRVKPNTQYFFRVVAENSIGRSDSSDIISFTTLREGQESSSDSLMGEDMPADTPTFKVTQTEVETRQDTSNPDKPVEVTLTRKKTTHRVVCLDMDYC